MYPQRDDLGTAPVRSHGQRVIVRSRQETPGQRDPPAIAEDFQRGPVHQEAQGETAVVQLQGGRSAQGCQSLRLDVIADLGAAHLGPKGGGAPDLELGLNIPQIAREGAERVVAGGEGLVVPFVLACIEARDLLDGLPEEAQAVRRSAQGQLAGEAHLLVERHLGVLAAAHPGDLDTPAIGTGNVAVGLDGVEVRTVVAGEYAGLGRERVAVERADLIVPVRRRENPPVFTGTALDGHLEEVGALVAARQGQGLEARPDLHVGRGEQGEVRAV